MKACDICGGPVVTPPYKLSEAKIAARKYCGWGCRAEAALRKRTLREAPAPPSEEVGSRNLLRSLIIYGLRNDGLPGLPASELIAKARELDVAA